MGKWPPRYIYIYILALYVVYITTHKDSSLPLVCFVGENGLKGYVPARVLGIRFVREH